MKKWVLPLLILLLFAGSAANALLYIKQSFMIKSNKGDIGSLRAELATVNASAQNEISSLHNVMQSVAGNITSLRSSVGDIGTDVRALTGNISALSDTVVGLQRSRSNSGPFADFTNAIEQAKPSVVIIETQVVTTVFPGRRVTQQAVGSGWIVNSDGIIVTNNHVIADAVSIKVTLADRRTFTPQAVWGDSSTDLAVVKINAPNLPVAMIGDSDKLQVGQPVAAIGNALGFGYNMTGGWVSRLNASITFNDGRSLSGLIGTDAAINPGNSGGPLINLSGEVIGITNAKLVQTGVEGIGYAISINSALKTINSLIARL